jgi:hypothetical protein
VDREIPLAQPTTGVDYIHWVGIGIGGAIGFTQLMSSLLFGLKATDIARSSW